jgi:hypothetical protein
MTTDSLPLSFSLDPLVAEAKRRARRRRVALVLIGGLLAAGAAVGVYLTRAPQPGGTPGSNAATNGSDAVRHYTSRLGFSMRLPHGIHVEQDEFFGKSWAVDETTFSSFRSRRGVHIAASVRELPPRIGHRRFPADGIALRVDVPWWCCGFAAKDTRFPLRLSSFRSADRPRDWYSDTHPRPLYHVVFSKGHRYVVTAWIGQKASARQRAVLARMIASVSFRHPRQRARTVSPRASG